MSSGLKPLNASLSAASAHTQTDLPLTPNKLSTTPAVDKIESSAPAEERSIGQKIWDAFLTLLRTLFCCCSEKEAETGAQTNIPTYEELVQQSPELAALVASNETMTLNYVYKFAWTTTNCCGLPSGREGDVQPTIGYVKNNAKNAEAFQITIEQIREKHSENRNKPDFIFSVQITFATKKANVSFAWGTGTTPK